MRKRLPRIRRWEYLNCVLETVGKESNTEGLESCLVEMKFEFERRKSIAMGRGSPKKKGLKKAGELVRDSLMLAEHLDLIEEEGQSLTEKGQELRSVDIASSEFVGLVLPTLVNQYIPIQDLLLGLRKRPDEELAVPERRDIKGFRKHADPQGLFIGQTDYMIARDLLGQLGFVNWFLFNIEGERFSRVYLASEFHEQTQANDYGEKGIQIDLAEKELWIHRRAIDLKKFVGVLWEEYIGLAKGIPLRPVFYSHLRDAVCYNQRIGDHVFDMHMTELLTEQDWGNLSVFGSGGTIPYSRHSSSVLKSLPLKFADGRYIVYIKMEKV